MSDNINLLVKKDNNALKEQQKLKVFRLVAGGFLVVILLTSLTIYLLNLQLSGNSLEENRNSALSDMLPFREKEAKQIIVNNRIEKIKKVLGKRVDISKIINTFLEKASDEILVDSLELDENKITLKISSSSLIKVDEFINNLVDLTERKEIIKVLTLDSLGVSELDGIYRTSLIIEI